MKKLLCLLLCLLCLPFGASAELDLTALTYDELIELQLQITEELISRPEAKEQAYSLPKSCQKMLGNGLQIIFSSENGLYGIFLGLIDFPTFKAATQECLEQIIKEAAQIELP